jgi:hypothetical protein
VNKHFRRSLICFEIKNRRQGLKTAGYRRQLFRTVLKLVKLQSLVAKCCKMRKIWPCKVHKFCTACGNCYHFRPKCGSNFRTQYKSVRKLRTLQGYIFRILQHFATKLCNFTHSSMLFQGIYFFCQDKKLDNNGNCLLLHLYCWSQEWSQNLIQTSLPY